jgi:hypothetical protein
VLNQHRKPLMQNLMIGAFAKMAAILKPDIRIGRAPLPNAPRDRHLLPADAGRAAFLSGGWAETA